MEASLSLNPPLQFHGAAAAAAAAASKTAPPPASSIVSSVSPSSIKDSSSSSSSSSCQSESRRRVGGGKRRRGRRRMMVAALEQPGGKMVVELVGAFNQLSQRMRMRHSHSHILFNALKLSLPFLHSLPPLPDGRSPISKALSIAFILADLQMDVEVISAGLLTQVVLVDDQAAAAAASSSSSSSYSAAAISISQVRDMIGTPTAHLLHECIRLKTIPTMLVDSLDRDTASALRKFCLTYYDVRALILHLVLMLDTMTHLHSLPRHRQQMISLQAIHIYAPLAHAVGANLLSQQLEDLSFQYLFPYSYLYLDTWLRRTHDSSGSTPLIDIYKDHLLQSLTSDPSLSEMVQNISIQGRYKSRYSTMKKLIRDGRKPEQVNDILGLRVILNPAPGLNSSHLGEKACYRVREIIRSLWEEIPSRSKDYIMHPKANGYRSLHMAVDINDKGRRGPLMEIQIRTTEMDMYAAGGTASHALYKGGLTDPEEAKRLKAIMMAAAELAALRLKDFPSTNNTSVEIDHRDRVFRLLDKNGDGKLSIDELMEVMEELGAQGEDAREMMEVLDSNSDGSLSTDEFDLFQKQVEFVRNLEEKDVRYRTLLHEKLQIQDGGEKTQERHYKV